MKSKRLRRRVVAVVVGVLLAALAGEAAFTVYRLVWHGELSRSVAIAERESLLAAEGAAAGDGRWENQLVIHPFFGYLLNPDSPGVNNFGFRTRYDFELAEHGYRIAGVDPEKALVVGIFGGSFADYTAMAGQHLERRLAAAFPDRRPIVLDMAIGGHALPQAGFVFLYFKELVDVAVFLDGLNEIWNAPVNNAAGVPPEYAKAGHFLYKLSRQELSPETFARTAGVLEAKRGLAAVTELSLAPGLRHSLLVHYALWRPLSRHWSKRIADESLAIERGYATAGRFFEVPDAQITAHAVERWHAHHRWIHELAAQAGVLDLHLLQPNPRVEGSKELTAAEQEAIERLPIGDFVAAGYPGLRREVARFATEGLLAEDLTMLLEDRRETLWMDGAHLLPAGSVIVLDRIAELVTAHLGEAAGGRNR